MDYMSQKACSNFSPRDGASGLGALGTFSDCKDCAFFTTRNCGKHSSKHREEIF